MLPVKSILKEYLTDDTDDILEATTPSAVAEAVAEAEADADAELNAVLPVIHEENVVGPVVDLSGATVAPEPVPEPVPELAAAPVPVPESTPAPTPTPTPAPEPVVPAASPTTSVPLIIVETESPVVGFTQRDTVFDSENSEKNTIRMSPHEDDDDDDAYAGGIEIDESAPAMDIDDFENLNEVDEDENVAFENDEFETL
jgi:hypothetical protein